MKGRVTDTIKPQKSFLDTLADADEFMKGRVTDTTKPAPKFTDTDTDVSISPEDEKFINDMSLLPKGLDALTHGLGTAGDLAIKYAKGDMTPVTSSPGPS